MLKPLKSRNWEIEQSSLGRKCQQTTYKECRKYSCEDIARSLTPIPENAPFILEIPEDVEFHFIGRVDTGTIIVNNQKLYYGAFEARDYISFSTINNGNISRYKGGVFFAYNILPEDIVHVFPADSNTYTQARHEGELTKFPSFWVTLEELEKMTQELGVYNQVTCKTKREGKIIKPSAVVAFGELDDKTIEIANEFGIGCIIVHPKKGAMSYVKDLIDDYLKLKEVAAKLKRTYGINFWRAVRGV